MKPRIQTFMTIAALAAAVSSGCAAAPTEREVEIVPADTARAEPPLNSALLPANTHLTVALDVPLDPANVRVGTPFTVSVVEPITARNGMVVIPDSTVITGMVTGVHTADELGGITVLRINFLRMDLNGVNHPLSAAILSTALGPPDASSQPDSAMTAPRGAVVRGELRDALVRGGLGVGAGSIVSLGYGAEAVALPAGTRMTIRNFDNLDLRP